MTVNKPSHLIPKLRFPEFCNAPEWEEKKLGEVSEVLMCKRIFASETNQIEGCRSTKLEHLEEYRTPSFPRRFSKNTSRSTISRELVKF